jgi:hypothetical protein
LEFSFRLNYPKHPWRHLDLRILQSNNLYIILIKLYLPVLFGNFLSLTILTDLILNSILTPYFYLIDRMLELRRILPSMLRFLPSKEYLKSCSLLLYIYYLLVLLNNKVSIILKSFPPLIIKK